MAHKKELLVDGYTVEIVKHARAKNVRIRLQPNKPVRVTIPMKATYGLGEHFLMERLSWIKKNMPLLEAKSPVKTFGWHYALPILGGEIYFRKSNSDNLTATRIEGNIELSIPSRFDFLESKNHTLIENWLIEELRAQAKIYLPNRLAVLAKEKGFDFGKVTVKKLKSRWGSCSAVNNINLNIHLMRLPAELIDYVLIHELQHTTIKNHSVHFWQSLESNWPGAKQFDKQLNRFSPRIL